MRRESTIILFCIFFTSTALSQYCPATGNCNFNVYIDDFTFHTISNLNSAGSNCNTTSYINTGLSTTVTKGNTYTLTVQCGPQYVQGVGIWIDYNQDYDFDDNGEFVWASPYASLNTFIDSITIPQTALTGSTRMRVRSKWNATFTAGESCGAVTWGEIEDYTVIIQPNTSPPVADFVASTTLTCSGNVDFYDLSTNAPTGWSWDFGDLGTSVQQNPTHTYTNSGTYTVSLTVTNNYGNDTKVMPNYITVNIGSGPISANCTPVTTAWCCGFGITNVTFNTINNPSSDGSAGYEDFTCSQTSITAGVPYPISITTDVPSEHNIRVWIDYNNDGDFSSAELAFSADQVFVGTGNITAPSTAVQNTPIRMRIAADYYLNPIPTPCADPQVGQVEDYTVTVLPNTNLPVAAFTADTFSCTGTVQFTDLSANAPTFWQWNFGDGNFSTLQNPVHTYTNSGTYTVKLIAYNNNGTDTAIYTDYIDVDLSAAPASVCNVTTMNYCCNYGIYSVQFEAINNTTDGASDNYMDYSCTQVASVTEGNTYPIQINTGLDNPEDVWVWIDYNDDGTLDNSELVFTSLNNYSHSGNIAIPTNVTYSTPLRMRITSDFTGSNRGPCDNTQWGQTEDYAVIISSSVAPTALFSSDSTVICMGTVQFMDQSSGNPTSWYWDFGDGNISTIQNPSHTYANYGQYDVWLKVSNQNGSDSLYIPNYITYDSCTVSTEQENELSERLLLFPNPVSNTLYIRMSGQKISSAITVTLFDISGQEVYRYISKPEDHILKLNLADLHSGMYFVVVENGGKKAIRHIVLVNSTI